MERISGWTSIRLCIETGQPIDPGNYEGPVHCMAHPEGHNCTTALFDRRDETITTELDRQAALDRMAGLWGQKS